MSKLTMLYGASSYAESRAGGGAYAMFYGTAGGSTSYATMAGQVALANGLGAFDEDDQTLTFSQSGTYTLTWFAKGVRDGGGTARAMSFVIYQNDTALLTQTGVTYNGETGTLTVTASAGDTIHVTTRAASTTPVPHDFGYCIT